MAVILGLWLTILALPVVADVARPGRAAATIAPGSAVPVVHYRFTPATVADGRVINLAPDGGYTGRLRGGLTAWTADGVSALRFNGTNGFIDIDGSETLHLGDDGLTIAATVRLHPDTDAKGPAIFGMIAFKPDEYLFGVADWGKTGVQQLYSNIRRDGGEWTGMLNGGEVNRGEWTHFTAIIERLRGPAPSENGYVIHHFLNGIPAGSSERHVFPGRQSAESVTIGKGWGGPWFLDGDIAEVRIYDHALAPPAFEALLREETLAAVIVPPAPERDRRYPDRLAAVRERIGVLAGGEQRSWKRLLAAVENAWYTVASESRLVPFLDTISALAEAGEPKPETAFAAAHRDFVFLDTEELGLTFFRPQPGRFVWSGLFDRQRNRELLGRQDALLLLDVAQPTLYSLAPAARSTLEVDTANGRATLRWQAQLFATQVTFTPRHDRLDMEARLELGLGSGSADMPLFLGDRPRGELERLAAAVITGDCSITPGRLATEDAVRLGQDGRLKWNVPDVTGEYLLDVWFRPLAWDGFSTDTFDLLTIDWGGEALVLRKPGERPGELHVVADGTIVTTFPVYNWIEQDWMGSDERHRWHCLSLAVTGDSANLTLDGFPGLEVGPVTVGDALHSLTFAGGPGTVFAWPLVRRNATFTRDELWSRFCRLYTGNHPDLTIRNVVFPRITLRSRGQSLVDRGRVSIRQGQVVPPFVFTGAIRLDSAAGR